MKYPNPKFDMDNNAHKMPEDGFVKTLEMWHEQKSIVPQQTSVREIRRFLCENPDKFELARPYLEKDDWIFNLKFETLIDLFSQLKTDTLVVDRILYYTGRRKEPIQGLDLAGMTSLMVAGVGRRTPVRG